MKNQDFKKILKEDNPKHILFRHMYSCFPKVKGIYLTDKQLQKVIDLKNKR